MTMAPRFVPISAYGRPTLAITIGDVVAYLNDLLEVDREGITRLVNARVPCNERLAGDRYVMVLTDADGRSMVGYTYTGVAGKMRSADDVEAEYLRVGRCAFDREHEVAFTDDRWEALGEELRRCRWCGKEATLVNEVRIIKRWRMVTSPLTAEAAVEAS